MKTTTTQTDIPLWHYLCPQCGVGDPEAGYHAPTHMIYCEICLEEGEAVRLRRWPVEESGPAS